jgi:hypothetical protein
LQAALSTNMVARMANHLTGNLFYQFAKNLFPGSATELAQTETFLTALLSGGGQPHKKQAVLKTVYRYWLLQALQQQSPPGIPHLLENLYQALQTNGYVNAAETQPAAATPILSGAAKPTSTNPLAIVWQQLLTQKIATAMPARKPSPKPIAAPKDLAAPPTMAKAKNDKGRAVGNAKMQTGPIDKTAAPITEPVQPMATHAASSPATVADAGERDAAEPMQPAQKAALQEALTAGVFIENAGAIIVAPFLPALFAKLKWAQKGRLHKPEAAALLVQHLVSGAVTIGEAELLLPKILCGLEPDAPVDIGKKITPLQKKEATALLTSVVEHWAVLKNTTVAGLREAFLQRNGKLSFNNNQWLLQVEQKGYDMLLQQLPWNIGMVKLPWMGHVMMTEWA